MKKTSILILIFSLLLIYSCDKPAPTELVNDTVPTDDKLEIEIIAENPTDPLYSNGFDTTGITTDLTNFTNFIIVNGTKTTSGNSTIETSFAKAVFFDKNFPVSVGGRVVGYVTRTPGILRINNIQARHLPLKITYRLAGGGEADTILGLHYALYNKGRNSHNDFIFEYNSIINFQFIPLPIFSIDTVNFNFLTPPEITGSLSFSGREDLVLLWNRSDLKNIEIIIGGLNNRNKAVPLYKLRTSDDGRLIIPVGIIRQIDKDRFNKISFSLIRKIEYLHTGNRENLYLLSQSIHTLITDNP